jgi:integrase
VASLVRPWQVRYVKDGKRVPKGTPGAKQVKGRARKWYAQGVPGWPKRKRQPLASDKAVAKVMLADLVRDAEKGGAGMVDPHDAQRKRLLADHLDDFRKELEARGNGLTYVRDVAARLAALFEGCAFRTVDDLSASKAAAWLAQQRQEKSLPPLPEGKERFTLLEAAEAVCRPKGAVSRMVFRYRLAAEGRRNARRFPRATVETLRARFSRGMSVQTSNHALKDLKGFCRWMVRDRRMRDNPMEHLEAGNVATDQRHARRELTAAELRRLLDATRASPRAFRGLSGEDRFHLYATACGTGFRASALASLTPERFDLAATTPVVTLAVHKDKSRKGKVQPLPADLAGKPAGERVWGGTWAQYKQGAEMLRIDLEAAGIPYVVEGPDGPLFADFHSLRHSYLTLGGLAGIDLRTLQELAGHSTPVLTARYSHRNLDDLAGAVARLPSLLPTDDGAEAPAQTPRPDVEAAVLGLVFYRAILALLLAPGEAVKTEE